MGQIFEAIVDYLNEDDWPFSIVKEDMAMVLNFRGRSGSWQCFVNVDEERQWFSFYSILPHTAPKDKRAAIAEFLTRANYGLVIGNFEMDYNDGEVRYKTFVDIEGGELSPKIIENVIQANLMTMDRYFRGIMSVLYGGKTPAEAINEVEHNHEPPLEDSDDLDDFDQSAHDDLDLDDFHKEDDDDEKV